MYFNSKNFTKPTNISYMELENVVGKYFRMQLEYVIRLYCYWEKNDDEFAMQKKLKLQINTV